MKKLVTLLAPSLVVLLVVGVLSTSMPTSAQMPAQLTAFSADWELVQPHDTNTLTRQPRAIMLAADGSFAALGWQDNGTACVTMTLLGGVIYPISPRKICDTNTDATSVLVLY